MSWETFKQNILRVSNNPDAINNIEVVADAYAKEYDAAIKNGFDSIHKTRVQNGDVESMKRFFISALQKGLTSTQPYDLVGEMGEGVKAYWATVTLGNEVVPTIPAPGSFQNIGVQTNRATVFGVWKKPITITEVNFELTDIERAEYQERLERAITKREEALNQGKIDEADTFLDAINAYTDCLTQNQKYNVPLDQLPPVLQPKTDVPITGSITQPISQTGNTGTNENGNSSTNEITTTTVTKDDDSFIDFDAPVTNTRDVIKEVKWTDGKPFVSGFKGGGFGGSYTGGPYGSPTFPPNATLGQKVAAIALRDATVTPPAPVEENPKYSNWGHPRIEQILANCGLGANHWCACTVSTWWDEAGAGIKASKNPNKFSDGPEGNYRRSYVPDWWEWAAKNGRLVDRRNGANANVVPQPGWAVIYHWQGKEIPFNHIGIFWKAEGDVWYGIDGNLADLRLGTHVINKSAAVGLVIC
jgi:hypothetical protein